MRSISIIFLRPYYYKSNNPFCQDIASLCPIKTNHTAIYRRKKNKRLCFFATAVQKQAFWRRVAAAEPILRRFLQNLLHTEIFFKRSVQYLYYSVKVVVADKPRK